MFQINTQWHLLPSVSRLRTQVFLDFFGSERWGWHTQNHQGLSSLLSAHIHHLWKSWVVGCYFFRVPACSFLCKSTQAFAVRILLDKNLLWTVFHLRFLAVFQTPAISRDHILTIIYYSFCKTRMFPAAWSSLPRVLKAQPLALTYFLLRSAAMQYVFPTHYFNCNGQNTSCSKFYKDFSTIFHSIFCILLVHI